jgi:transposase
MRMFEEVPAVYLHREAVDFRKSINGLAAIVETGMGLSSLSGAVYVFCNRRRDKLKVLYWDRSGYALWYKRLEEQKFAWPRRWPEAVIELSEQQLHWLLSGYDITRLQPHKALRYQHVS